MTSKILRAGAVASVSFVLFAVAAGGASAQSDNANPKAQHAKLDKDDAESEDAGKGPAGTAKNVPYGLCHAYGRANSHAKANAKSFARLRETATAAGTDVAGLCANVAPPGLSKGAPQSGH
jgi:hypothetical protein